MSFLDQFEFAFQDIKLYSKTTNVWKYGEKITSWETTTQFRWVILEIKQVWQYFLDKNKNLWFTSKDFELRCNNNIIPKKWDTIEDSFWNLYNVIYSQPQVVDGLQDHIISIIRLND